MNQLVREKIETKLEKIIALAKNQDAVIVKRGDVAEDVRATFRAQSQLVEDVKDLIKIA